MLQLDTATVEKHGPALLIISGRRWLHQPAAGLRWRLSNLPAMMSSGAVTLWTALMGL